MISWQEHFDAAAGKIEAAGGKVTNAVEHAAATTLANVEKMYNGGWPRARHAPGPPRPLPGCLCPGTPRAPPRTPRAPPGTPCAPPGTPRAPPGTPRAPPPLRRPRRSLPPTRRRASVRVPPCARGQGQGRALHSDGARPHEPSPRTLASPRAKTLAPRPSTGGVRRGASPRRARPSCPRRVAAGSPARPSSALAPCVRKRAPRPHGDSTLALADCILLQRSVHHHPGRVRHTMIKAIALSD